ncbi:MAG: exodeoxyribonuclease VII large subunit [Sphingomonadales bacterium]
MSEAGTNIQEFSVSEISQLLKRKVEESFSYVRIRGEISGLKRPASGHVYLALKDEKAVLDAVIWRGVAGDLSFVPEDGLEVVCSGKLTTYPARSKYQLVIERLEPAGEGALMALLEERRKKLAAEGLFDAGRKKPIPFLPEMIGVVTSPTGAVIRDILHRLDDRFPRRVLVWPVLVQGKGAADQIAAAISGFNALPAAGEGLVRPDVLIVARGGGSLEDLWAFNEENVVRAAAESEIPLITAVGHETDTTLIDHAGDLRAPTPSAAAEFAVPVRAELRLKLGELQQRKERLVQRFFERQADRLTGLARGLPSPMELLGLARQKLDEMAERLPRSLKSLTQDFRLTLERITARMSLGLLAQNLKLKQSRFQGFSRLLDTLSYQSVLARGFAVLYDKGGQPVTSALGIGSGEEMAVELTDGRVPVVTTGGEGPAKKAVRKSVRKQKTDPKQGSFL